MEPTTTTNNDSATTQPNDPPMLNPEAAWFAAPQWLPGPPPYFPPNMPAFANNGNETGDIIVDHIERLDRTVRNNSLRMTSVEMRLERVETIVADIQHTVANIHDIKDGMEQLKAKIRDFTLSMVYQFSGVDCGEMSGAMRGSQE